MAHYYRFNPKIVDQSNPYRCWAAALASWLDCIYRAKGKVTSGTWHGSAASTYKVYDGMSWSRDIQDQNDIVNQYSTNLDGNGGLKKEGIIDIIRAPGWSRWSSRHRS